MRRIVPGFSLAAALLLPLGVLAQPARGPVVLGQKLADGQAYAAAVQLQHQRNNADNGRIFLSFEESGMLGIPLYESRDNGASWQLVMHVTDPAKPDHAKCNLHWQPHLTEMPRTVGALKAGTILLSASSVCNGDNGRMASMQLQLYASADLGRSWKFVGAVADGTAELPVWEPHLQVLDDGKLVTFYSSETHKSDGYNQLLSHKVSADGGKTWGPEIYDTAIAGGVERPGMVIVDRMPDRRYVMTYEDVEGPVQNQVHLKYSADGLNWGDPASRGMPIQTQSGLYPINCPTIRWLPGNGPRGILLVSARGDSALGLQGGRSFYWNANGGEGPWWEVPTPVQKLGNGRAGWTQAMLPQADGSLLHITSSASAEATANTSRNQMLFASGKLDFNRYEAEDAAQIGSALMRDPSMSNGAKVRLGAKDVGRLTFDIYLPKTGRYSLGVNYAGIGFDSTPRLTANGAVLSGSTASVKVDETTAALRNRDLGTRGTGEHRLLSATVELKAGENRIEIAGGPYALDVDYLEVTPQP
ncbi:MAG TPA: hypothetical protein VGM26_13665 [Rhizomicrobium sp.]|jgi:hypothetical protein